MGYEEEEEENVVLEVTGWDKAYIPPAEESKVCLNKLQLPRIFKTMFLNSFNLYINYSKVCHQRKGFSSYNIFCG